jgi:hypothetical protein
MYTPPNAVRRPARDGGAHLTLVTDQDEPAPAGPADDDRQPAGRHAAPVVRVPLAGSATMRALMALGAVLSAVGLSFGTAGAALGFDGQEIEEADPDIAPVPEAIAPIDPAPSTPTTPAHAAPAVAARTAPGHWAPAIKPVKAHTYKLSAPVTPGTGRHRKPVSAEGPGEQSPVTGQPGRHRHTQTHTPQTPGAAPMGADGNEHTGRHDHGGHGGYGHGHGEHGHGRHHHDSEHVALHAPPVLTVSLDLGI